MPALTVGSGRPFGFRQCVWPLLAGSYFCYLRAIQKTYRNQGAKNPLKSMLRTKAFFYPGIN
jgi:hypothetical protein